MKKTLSIACDHAGLVMKEPLVKLLEAEGFKILDKGVFSAESVDYPDYAHLACEEVLSGNADFGVLVCASGIGMSIVGNKHRGIRAALCHNLDCALFSRLHNNANVICMGAKYVDAPLALEMVKTFAQTSFEGGRHGRRVEKITEIEKENL